MILFFATGMYREKVVYASKFVPQCNRALRSFNLHFNRDELGQLSFYRRIPKRFQEEFNTYRQHYYARKRGHTTPGTARGASTSSSHQSASSRETTPEGLPVMRSRPAAGERKRNTGGVKTKKGKARDTGLSIPGRETEESGRDTDRSD
ncbi:hypothetical protein BC937DRAFT_95518 [Endogone sp. FLAS-F59071]|nr:hypothetical protein BC937DRAFT_95518 [Endogone sp. FLAS-F59071]|eukprot:RUS20302.1 hypothetical protein BC937DRAFT_95518 [Endogone sp. FLAS-F59071]